MKTNFRLPVSQLTLPGGFKIKVYYKSDKQCSRGYGTGVWGYWEVARSGGKIVLNRDAPEWRRIQTFGHELIHAVNDYEHWLSIRVDALKREAEETAKALSEDDEE